MIAKTKSIPDTEHYKVLSYNDFLDRNLENNGMFLGNASLLIPRSYEYTSFIGAYEYVRTEYSNALNEKIARHLVNRYIYQAENALIGNYSRELEGSFEEGVYDAYLELGGLIEEDFDNLKVKGKGEAIDKAGKIIRQKSIVKDEENLWGLDEVYFLNYQRDEVVLRDGKEVFYLKGREFSDPKVIEISRYKLELD